MPYKSEKIIKLAGTEKDRRVKFTEEMKARSIILRSEGMSWRAMAKIIGVDRKTLKGFFIPEFKEKCKEYQKGRWILYYDKDKHNIYMKTHRNYKQKLYKESNDYNRTSS